jgi:radical SAM protein with 4Fe4S-binding SPASM domain
MGPAGDKLFACGAGNGLCIDAYGFVQPCMSVRTPELTFDLFSSSSADKKNMLARALDFFKNLKEMKTTNPEYLRRCAICFLKGLCEQCPAKSWAEYGTLDTPVEYLCEIVHAQARYLGWLKNGEKAWEVQGWEERLKSKFKEHSRTTSGN